MRLSVFSRSIVLTGVVGAGLWACGGSSAALDPLTRPLENGIIDGTPSTAKDYPATGVLLFVTERDDGDKYGSMLCSGTLVAPDVVMVAAHCDLALFVPSEAPVDYYFSFALDVSHFGERNVDLPEHTVKVAKMVPHPKFNLDKVGTGLRHSYDIALLYLEEPVKDVTPAAIMRPEEASQIEAGAEVAIVGYGRRHEQRRRNDAGIKYHGMTKITEVGKFEMQISPGSPQPHKCHGDSGGPTYFKVGSGRSAHLAVVGITSHAYDNEDCLHGGVDTRVDPYLPWIKKSLDQACVDGGRPACPSPSWMPN